MKYKPQTKSLSDTFPQLSWFILKTNNLKV